MLSGKERLYMKIGRDLEYSKFSVEDFPQSHRRMTLRNYYENIVNDSTRSFDDRIKASNAVCYLTDSIHRFSY